MSSTPINPSIFSQRVSWNATAQEVSRRLGRTYSGQYVREVARGWRTNALVQPILAELGLMPAGSTEPKPSAKDQSAVPDSAPSVAQKAIEGERARIASAKHLPNALREILGVHGCSVASLANLLGASPRALRSWIDDGSTPDASQLAEVVIQLTVIARYWRQVAIERGHLGGASAIHARSQVAKSRLIERLLAHRRRLAAHLRDSMLTSRCQALEIRRQADEIRHLRGAIERVTLGKSAEILRVQEENEHLRQELHELQAAALRAVRGCKETASEALGEAYRATLEAASRPLPIHRRVSNWLRGLKRS